ncbi:cytochrome P450 3A13 [Caerostris extrusa]|uniref:Cytochrome P450 3A13 n=1 Tax=Caerostris extrusa TaxID=172846 RepID=A0AAV4R6R2_CAEEX|nr:cytochrome P450 3A13 [Caerostris extrusa]
MFGTELLYGSLVVNCLIGLTTILLIYWYSVRNHDHWKKKGIPYVKPWPLIGTVTDILKKPFHEIETERYNKLGPIYGHFEANNPLLSVADPTLLRDILVKDFPTFNSRRIFSTGDKVIDNMLTIIRGEDWKRVRTIVTPTFTTGKIRRMLNIFKDCSETLANNFIALKKEGKYMDAKRMYGAFTMDIIASSAFSTKINSHNDPDNELVKWPGLSSHRGWDLVVAPRLMTLLRISIFGGDATDFFKNITLQIIEERKRTGQVRNDFLQLLMDTAKEVSGNQNLDTSEKDKGDIATNYAESDAGHQIFKTVTSKNLSLDELVAQCVIFFLAGYDTTASTLSFASYQLALNQSVQDKLREEVDQVIQENNGQLTYEAVQSMKYLDNVIAETLRMYPPLIRLERCADTDFTLGDTGLTINKGTIITIPIYAMHRDPKLFPEPEQFDPDRFTAEERVKRDPYSYLPFGAGPRNCVGMRFALMEVKVCLAYVIAHFKINKCPKTMVPLEFNLGQQGLIQPKEILLDMEIREDCPLSK